MTEPNFHVSDRDFPESGLLPYLLANTEEHGALSRRAFVRLGIAAGALTLTQGLASCGRADGDRDQSASASTGGPGAASARSVPSEVAASKGGKTRDCPLTEDNIEGPFYRPGAPFRSKLLVPDEAGDFLLVSGLVMDRHCHALADAMVDIWHANAHGVYDNDSGQFRLRGRMRTDHTGQYVLQTVMPGRYKLGGSGYGVEQDNYRPAHVHYKISKAGFRTLTTQLYFKGDPYNGRDPFIRKSLIVDLRKDAVGKRRLWRGTFDIILAEA